MGKEKWLFIGTDKRMARCSQIMRGRQHLSEAVHTDTMSKELEKKVKEFNPDHIVFPIHEMKEAIPLTLLKEGTKLYTGMSSKKWDTVYKNAGFQLESYLKEELFIWKNAQLTAQAFLAFYYNHTKRSVAGSRFHISGYGRIGKIVAHVLTSLGANVTIVARSDAQLGEALVRGFKVVRMEEFIAEGQNIVNTAPAQWLTLENDSKTVLYDLASAPGCLTESSSVEYYKLLPGLPGKYFPSDAALALADAVERINRR